MARAVSAHRARSRLRVRRAVAGFVAVYGWRAYALPALVAVTVVVLVQALVGGHATMASRRTLRGPTPGAVPRMSGRGTPPATVPSQLTDATACAGSASATRVVVSISLQHVWMCRRRSQVKSSAATTGAIGRGDATPVGSWLVQARQTNRYLVGPGYRDFVHYWVPFDGDFGFHDASWQTMPFGAPGYRIRGSNGCVHLPMSVMSWLYDWVRVGQTVVTVQM